MSPASGPSSTAIPADVTVTGNVIALHPEIEVALLRIAQEALANVARHAGATRAGLTLSFIGDVVTLDVRDDGVGFAVPEPDAAGSSGFGLSGMRQRVARVAGSLAIESEPGGGTALSARVPAIAAGSSVASDVMSPIRLMIVDDHPVVRDGLRGMLAGDPDLDVVGEASDGAEALALVESLRPDVVLMDLRMPGLGGAAAIRALAERGVRRQGARPHDLRHRSRRRSRRSRPARPATCSRTLRATSSSVPSMPRPAASRSWRRRSRPGSSASSAHRSRRRSATASSRC